MEVWGERCLLRTDRRPTRNHIHSITSRPLASMVRLCEILARAAAARERGDSNTRTFASSAGVSRAGCARAGSVVGARPGAAARRVFYKLRLTAGSGGGAQRVHLVAVGDELRLRDESLARAAGARERRSLLPPPILVNFVPKQPLRSVVLARSASLGPRTEFFSVRG